MTRLKRSLYLKRTICAVAQGMTSRHITKSGQKNAISGNACFLHFLIRLRCILNCDAHGHQSCVDPYCSAREKSRMYRGSTETPLERRRAKTKANWSAYRSRYQSVQLTLQLHYHDTNSPSHGFSKLKKEKYLVF